MTFPGAEIVDIVRVGQEGDGIAAMADGAALFVPFGLPGERVLVRPSAKRGEGFAARIEGIERSSPERVPAACVHFGVCGGCALQHWEHAAYSAWKSGLLTAALQRAGYAIAPLPTIVTPPHSRRRMDLAIRRVAGGTVELGLHAARDKSVVDLAECTVLHPDLVALLPRLRAVLKSLQALGQEGSAVVNLLDSGPDILLRTDKKLAVSDRTFLANFAAETGCPRISWAQNTGTPETAALLRPPVTSLSGTNVTVPPGGFMQATREGEAAIVAAAMAGLPAKPTAKARVLELFAGSGTLTFAIAKHMRVHAVEGDAAAFASLKAACNATGQTGRITVEHRDLARQPLQAKEIAGFDTVVLDPPHGGAAAQIGLIAASGVKRVIYVSCNPTALGRDALALKQAGYKLASAQPVDQFLWSARLESVCVFTK
jgi:23S rRNA (uracil1939-C5)-methyltransferase